MDVFCQIVKKMMQFVKSKFVSDGLKFLRYIFVCYWSEEVEQFSFFYSSEYVLSTIKQSLIMEYRFLTNDKFKNFDVG